MLCPVNHLANLSAKCWVVRRRPPSQPTHTKQETENLSTVSECVDEEVDATIDGKEEMTNEKKLGTDRNKLKKVYNSRVPSNVREVSSDGGSLILIWLKISQIKKNRP